MTQARVASWHIAKGSSHNLPSVSVYWIKCSRAKPVKRNVFCWYNSTNESCIRNFGRLFITEIIIIPFSYHLCYFNTHENTLPKSRTNILAQQRYSWDAQNWNHSAFRTHSGHWLNCKTLATMEMRRHWSPMPRWEDTLSRSHWENVSPCLLGPGGKRLYMLTRSQV